VWYLDCFFCGYDSARRRPKSPRSVRPYVSFGPAPLLEILACYAVLGRPFDRTVITRQTTPRRTNVISRYEWPLEVEHALRSPEDV
jgi:hypothetical protein